MVEIVASMVSDFMVDPIKRQFSYLCNYKHNFEDVKQEVEKLRDIRLSVQHRIDDARRKGEDIEQKVENWLNRVNEIIDHADKIIADAEKAKNWCSNWFCPNLLTRYQLSKKAVTDVKDIVVLREEGKFDKVSYRRVAEDIWIISNKGYEAFASRNSTLKEILNTLSNPNVHMIGMYGMGGVGKTTLAKEVGRQAKKDKLFDEVVFADVSVDPNIRKIQGEIADKLGLQFLEESESGRARTLHARLMNENKILVILDNIWGQLNLKTIGIPSGDDHKGCKVLLTARSLDVLSRDMDAQKDFLIGGLSGGEAWSLFKKMAGDNIEDRSLKSIANDVVNECGGLPIAIVTIASALRNKSVSEWENALRQLRRPSPHNFQGVLAKAYSAIEMSYNCLKGEELRKTFLLCSLMSYDAFILDLLKYSIGLGILEGVYTMDEACDKVYTLVRELKDSCLLLDGATNERFAMHDVVRDVAISIASRDQHVFTVRNEILCEWPDKNTLKQCTAISIYDSNISELHAVLECPQLEFLFMKTKASFFNIPENFFAGMGKLRVLDFTGMQLSGLSLSSIHLLVNLQTLCLDSCELGDITIIGELKELKILSFQRSSIQQLPQEIGQLTQLKLLDLSYCSKLKVIQPNVISSLSRLEELYLMNYSFQWEVARPNVKRSNASLDELMHLSQLTTLEIHIQDDKMIPEGFFSRKLKRYKIKVGYGWPRFDQRGFSRILQLKLYSICLEELKGFKNVEYLCLQKLQPANNVFCELDREGFSQLKSLTVQNNPHFLCIVESMNWGSCEAFPVLESLLLSHLSKLEKICRSQLTAESFCKLKIIEVENCDELKNIFSFSVANCLPQVQQIQVTHCKDMEEIFASIEVMDDVEFSKLRFLTLASLPQLRSFYSKVKKTPSTSQTTKTLCNEIISEDETDTPMSLFNEKVKVPHLEVLELCEINVGKIWHSQHSSMTSSVQNLTRLIVEKCGKLKYIFSSSTVRCVHQLRYLEIRNCSVLEEIVAKEGGEEATVMFEFPRLTFVRLCVLPELKTFYPGIHILECPMLEQSEVLYCDQLEYSFQNFLASKNQQKANLISQHNRNFGHPRLGGIEI